MIFKRKKHSYNISYPDNWRYLTILSFSYFYYCSVGHISKLFWQVWFWILFSLIIVACIVGAAAFIGQWGGEEEWKFLE